jgi:hypothetical protein
VQSRTGTFTRNVLYAAVCGITGPVFLVLGGLGAADPGTSDPDIPLVFLGVGALITLLIPVAAFVGARMDDRLITDRDRLPDLGRDDDSFTVWAPTVLVPAQRGRPARAEVLEATGVTFHDDTEGTYTTYGELDPEAPKPAIRLTVRVHPDGAEPFTDTRTWRVPQLCLSAVTAGRLVAMVGPAADRLSIDWPRSLLVSGARRCRLRTPDGRCVDLTGHPDLHWEQIRIGIAGDLPMQVDTLDLGRVEPAVAAQLGTLIERAGDDLHRPAPAPLPGGECRWVVDQLLGAGGTFGAVGRRWARHGGQLGEGRLLELRPTKTYQHFGPVLEAIVRIWPGGGEPPIDARKKRLTVPMNYLAVLHRTKDVVVQISPDRRTYEIDWERSNLLAGVTPATVVGPTGERFDLTGQAGPLLAIMRILVAHRVQSSRNVLDLRRQGSRVAAEVMAVVPAAG